MNKVTTINLNGSAFQLEEDAFDTLRTYLDNAARQLGDNPDKDEIMADIEQAIGDKCRAVTSPYRTVVSAKEIDRIIAEMGPVDDGSASGAEKTGPAGTAAKPAGTETGAGPVRRIYRIYEGAMISGVCNGLAVHLGLDPTLVRVIFVVLAFITFGGMALGYFLLVVLLPSARTAEEKAAAHGTPSTAREFIRRAREGYYDAAKSFRDQHAHREWKRRFRREMRGWRRNFQSEVHAHADQWRANWDHGWTRHPGAYRGLWFTLSFLSLVRGLITVVGLFAFISLLTTDAVFGIARPADIPLWAAGLILLVVFQLFSAPLRASQRALSRHGWGTQPFAPVFFGLWDTFIWLGVVALSLWLIDRHVPHAHEALKNLPAALHELADSTRRWWSRQ